MFKKMLKFLLLLVFSLTIINVEADAKQTFPDLTVKSTGYNEINYVLGKKLIGLYTIGNVKYYKPQTKVTRGEAAIMILKAKGIKATAVKKSSFSDLKAGTSLSSSVETAVKLGYFKKNSTGKFNPYAAITKADTSYMLAQAFGLNPNNYTKTKIMFSDVTAKTANANAINALYYNGVVEIGNKKFSPSAITTREQMAIYLARAMSNTYRLPLPTHVSKNLEVSKAVVSTSSNLNVRALPKADSSSKIVGKLAKGHKITTYGVTGNFVKISYNGAYAYVGKSYISYVDQNYDALGKIIKYVYAKEAISGQAFAGKGAKVSGKFAAKAKIAVYKTQGQYYLTKIGDVPSYVLISNTVDKLPSSGTTTSKPPATTPPVNVTPPATTLTNSAIAKGVIINLTSNDSLNVRESMSTSSKVLGKLTNGAKVYVLRVVNNNWIEIVHDNSKAYISSSYMKFVDNSFVDVGSVINTVYAKETVKVYATPSTYGVVNNTVAKDTAIPVYKTPTGYYLTVINGIPGYVQTSKTTATKPNTNTPAPAPAPASNLVGKVTVSSLTVRATASSSAASLGSLKKGDIVSISSISGWWAKISYNGKVGYIHKTYLKLMNTTGSAVKGRIIVLDAGHGVVYTGSKVDPGAVSADGKVLEMDIALKVTDLVKQKLEKQGAIVKLSRGNQKFNSKAEELAYRVNFTNANFGELFISIHVNAATSSAAKGTETFYHVRTNDSSNEEFALATLINNKIVSEADMTNRGVKQASYQVINSTDIVSLLVELGFITNSSDLAKMKDSKYLEKFADAIYQGIMAYYKY